MSPSPGALNQAMVMSCDFFMPPAFGSVYSLGSMYNLFTSVLPRWYAWRAAVVENECLKNYKETQFKFSQSPPKILPILITNYQLKMAQDPGPPRRWVVDEIESNFVMTLHSFMGQLRREELMPPEDNFALRRGMAAMLQSFQPRNDGQMVSCLVSHQPRIIAVSEELGRTVNELTTTLYKREYQAGTKAEARIQLRGRGNGRHEVKVLLKEQDFAEFDMKLEYMQTHYERISEWLLWAKEPAAAASAATAAASAFDNGEGGGKAPSGVTARSRITSTAF